MALKNRKSNVKQEVCIVATIVSGKVGQVRIIRPARLRRRLLVAALREAAAVACTESDGDELRCRYCQCTEHNACVDDLSGEPCHWIDHGVCSATPCRIAHAGKLMAVAQRVLKGGA